MNPRRFIRTKLLGVSDKDLGKWVGDDYAHYTILTICLLIGGVVGFIGASRVDSPPLAAVAMLISTYEIYQLVLVILVWNRYRAQKRRPPPRP